MLNQLSKTIAPLGLTFFLSVLITTLLQSYLHPDMSPPPQSPKPSATKKSSLKERGFGSSSGGSGIGSEPLEQPKEPRPPTTPYRITFQPKALYTDSARANGIQGAVRLKIVLLANGTVGSITPVTELPYGLTEQAVTAARQIKFEPKRVDGRPVAALVSREYRFTIY